MASEKYKKWIDILLYLDLFELLENEQTDTIDEMKELLDEQQEILTALSTNWKGNSGQSFKRGKNNLLGQSVMSNLVLQQLKMESMFALENLTEVDDRLKKLFE